MKNNQINRLKVVLVEQGKTGKWLSEQLGKDPSTISLWCSNKVQPSLETLDKIATLLNVDVRELINKSKWYGKLKVFYKQKRKYAFW